MKTIFKGQSSVINADEYLPYKVKSVRVLIGLSIQPEFYRLGLLEVHIEMLSEIGFDNVRERIYSLKDYLADGLRNKGFQIYSDSFPELKTGILACKNQE